MEKPISLIIEDFKRELADTINKSSLPPVIIAPIMKEFYEEIRSLSVQQYQNDAKQYEEYLTNQKEAKEEKE